MNDDRKQKIIDKLGEAMEKAVGNHNCLEYERKENELLQLFLKGIISDRELEYALSRNKRHFAEVTLYKIEEIEFALRYLGVSEEEINRMVAHEQAHFKEAVVGGFDKARFCIRFDVTPDGQLRTSVGTQLCISNKTGLTDGKKRKMIRNAAAAPIDPSESDRKLSE